jgi:hypothetical protein
MVAAENKNPINATTEAVKDENNNETNKFNNGLSIPILSTL